MCYFGKWLFLLKENHKETCVLNLPSNWQMQQKPTFFFFETVARFSFYFIFPAFRKIYLSFSLF